MTEQVDTKWNASLYDDKHSFVFKYGEDLISLLNPKAGERILDLGCGTGHLTNEIASVGTVVVGIDQSIDMVAQATASFPNVDFRVMSGTDFSFDKSFDAIFSNATLHWIVDKEAVIDCMYRNLRKNGRLVLEMGGYRNIESILSTLKTCLIKYGFQGNANTNLWYFPSLGEYATLLEKRGFKVSYASYFNRETELKDPKNGVKDWIKMFACAYLKEINELEVDAILNEVQQILKPVLFKDGKWFADYKRLRIEAVKQKLD